MGISTAEVDVVVATSSLFELLSTTRVWLGSRRTSYADVGDWYARMMVRGLVRSGTGRGVAQAALSCSSGAHGKASSAPRLHPLSGVAAADSVNALGLVEAAH